MRSPSALLTTEEIGPAYLLVGAGAPFVARDFVQRVFCPHSKGVGRACGRCPACAKLAHGTHPDVRRVSAAGKSIRIDQIRALQREALYRPSEGERKVFLIEGAERLSPEAANSLLKILEDPPPYLTFLLTTDRPGEVLPTVASRCRLVRPTEGGWLNALLPDQKGLIEACWGNPRWLSAFEAGGEGAHGRTGDADTDTDVEPEASSPQALADGLREAEDLWAMCAGVRALFEALPRWNAAEVLAAAAQLCRLERPKLEYVLEGLLALGRRAALGLELERRPDASPPRPMSPPHPLTPPPQALDALESLATSYGALRGNANVQLMMESLLLRLWVWLVASQSSTRTETPSSSAQRSSSA